MKVGLFTFIISTLFESLTVAKIGLKVKKYKNIQTLWKIKENMVFRINNILHYTYIYDI